MAIHLHIAHHIAREKIEKEKRRKEKEKQKRKHKSKPKAKGNNKSAPDWKWTRPK